MSLPPSHREYARLFLNLFNTTSFYQMILLSIILLLFYPSSSHVIMEGGPPPGEQFFTVLLYFVTHIPHTFSPPDLHMISVQTESDRPHEEVPFFYSNFVLLAIHIPPKFDFQSGTPRLCTVMSSRFCRRTTSKWNRRRSGTVKTGSSMYLISGIFTCEGTVRKWRLVTQKWRF